MIWPKVLPGDWLYLKKHDNLMEFTKDRDQEMSLLKVIVDSLRK